MEKKKEKKKTTFITKEGTCCNRVMSFRLKNTRAIFQKLVIKIYQNLLRDKVEVYVDDLVIKSKKVELHVQHLEKDFKILHSYNIKLNPDKCTIRVTSEKFLRHLVTRLGIEIDST